MKNKAPYYNVPYSFNHDELSVFIELFTFIPHAFGHQVNDPGAVCGDRITGDFELIFVIGGENRITIMDREYRCGQGDIILIPPFTRHRIQTSESNPHNNYWIHFDVLPLYRQESFLTAMLCGGGYKLRPQAGVADELLPLYQTLEKELEDRKPGRMVFLNTQLVRILTLLLRSNNSSSWADGSKNYRPSAETEIVNRSSEFILNNVSKALRIADLCSELHISESYLFKAFSRILKVSPNDFILMYKVKTAEQLMKSTELTIKEISERLCFSSPYYFSSVFKRFYRLSPREYMQSCQ